MEEKELLEKDVEKQTTFNEDTIEAMNDGEIVIENIDKIDEEVDENANENE